MRRLNNSRDATPDPAQLQAFDSLDLEGDLRVETPDAIRSLRPFGRDLPDLALGASEIGDRSSEEEARFRAGELAKRGRRLEAMLVLRQHLHDSPGDVEGRVLLADLLEQANEPDQALEQLDLAVEKSDRSPAMLVRRGALYARMGRSSEAERDFREARRQDSTYCPAYRYLGTTLLRRGVAGEAITVLREALRLAPDDPEATLYLGEALATQGQHEEALRWLGRAIELLPADPRGYKLLGRLLDRLGRTDEAMIMHRKAHEVISA